MQLRPPKGSSDVIAQIDRVAVPGRSQEAEAPFEEFFAAESQTLFRRLCLVTGNPAEAEELMQDAFLRVWERWDRVGQMSDPTGYLYRTAMNLFRKRYRRAKLALRRTVRPGPAADGLAEAEARTEVADALASLPPRQRAALVMTDLLGFTSAEAAEVLGIRPGTVRALSSQARAALRATMGESE
jgi:RNA polymerase sigma-70 factor, ECF subfamily